jgi:hypothetical protein
MSAIISDQFRILNAETFNNYITSGINTAYTFMGQPYATNSDVGIGKSDWGFGPIPLDTIEQENRIKETVIALKKITSADVRRAVRKNIWESGQIYEMYRHDYSIYNLSPQTNSSSLYESNYYVLNENYRVYICLNNGANTENPLGRQSLDQPDFVDLEPRPAGSSGDGYIWKYLYTIKPADIIKFDTANYISLPETWGNPGTESSSIKNNAVSGKIESVIVKTKGTGYPASSSFSGIPILGDGIGGSLTIITNSYGEVSEAIVTDGGSGYTKGIVKFAPGEPGVPLDLSIVSLDGIAEFDVIIPPKGGHGYNIYNELGAYRILIYSRFETDSTNPDVIVGNDFATVGIINNPIVVNGATYVSALKGLRLIGVDTTYEVDKVITQTIGTGITAIGYVASWNNDTKILRYYQPAGAANASVGYTLNNFTSTPTSGGNLTITNAYGASLQIDTTFNGSTITINNGTTYNLGSNYTSGISSSEYEAGSGDIIYIDNRQPILRSLSQKEDIKIILEF